MVLNRTNVYKRKSLKCFILMPIGQDKNLKLESVHPAYSEKFFTS